MLKIDIEHLVDVVRSLSTGRKEFAKSLGETHDLSGVQHKECY